MVLLLNMGRQLIRRSECSRKGGMDAIKLEGGSPSRITAAKSIVEAVIAVMGHVGLTPQAISVLGGFRPQGKSVASAVKVVEISMALQEVRCFSVVLECVPAPVAAAATYALQIPTIGIGAGPFCSGQTRVMTGSPQSPLCCCRTSCEDNSSYNSVQVLGVGK